MGGGDYPRKAIILNISVKEVRRLIVGRLVFEEIRYISSCSSNCTLKKRQF